MSYRIRRWEIHHHELERLRIPKGEAIPFMRSLGVDTRLPIQNFQDPYQTKTVLVQKVPLSDPEVLSPLELKILNDILPDEEMWIYEPCITERMHRLIVAEPMPLSLKIDPQDPLQLLKPEHKELEVRPYAARDKDTFEVATLLVALDEDTLEVYWNRKTT